MNQRAWRKCSDHWLTTEQLAHVLGCLRETAVRWIRMGLIGHHKLNTSGMRMIPVNEARRVLGTERFAAIHDEAMERLRVLLDSQVCILEQRKKNPRSRRRRDSRIGYVTTGQAAAIMRVSHGSVARLADEGALESWRARSERRIDPASLAAYMRQQGFPEAWAREADAMVPPATDGGDVSPNL